MSPLHTLSPLPTAAAGRVDAPGGAPPDSLRLAAARLEGVFVEQLFKAMRETIPPDGVLHSGGEEMFTSLFDQELAGRAPEQWQDGLRQAIIRALRPAGASPEPR